TARKCQQRHQARRQAPAGEMRLEGEEIGTVWRCGCDSKRSFGVPGAAGCNDSARRKAAAIVQRTGPDAVILRQAHHLRRLVKLGARRDGRIAQHQVEMLAPQSATPYLLAPLRKDGVAGIDAQPRYRWS